MFLRIIQNLMINACRFVAKCCDRWLDFIKIKWKRFTHPKPYIYLWNSKCTYQWWSIPSNFFYSNLVCRLIHYLLVMLSSFNRKNFSFYSFSLILFERKVLCNFGKREISISDFHLSCYSLFMTWQFFGIFADLVFELYVFQSIAIPLECKAHAN